MDLKQVSNGAEVDERLAALMTNVSAVRAIAGAVEGTIGPKGLDTMLVDRVGDVIITNDGVTILDKMEVNHPAAKMIINIAKAQQSEVGDGTTTATVMAGALVAEGAEQVVRGVPVARVIEGVQKGIAEAITSLKQHSRSLQGLHDPVLEKIALIAGRENSDIACLVVNAAQLVGQDKLCDVAFKLSDTVTAQENADNEVFMGVLINKGRMNPDMPLELSTCNVIIVDDALEPEEIGEGALGTETGFTRYLQLQEQFKQNIRKLIELKVSCILVDRGVNAVAEELLTDAGILVIERVPNSELRRAAEHTGARMMKRTALNKNPLELSKYMGFAKSVLEDEKLEQIRILGGSGKPMATILVGASTEEVAGERERIAKDAASSVQAAVKGGYVPGGGAVELAILRDVAAARDRVKGMAAYGVDCVVSALRRPFSQIVSNAGFNPLEKVEQVLALQTEQASDSLSVDCESGDISDMLQMGVVDPMLVKLHAIKAAGEVATAILRINTIIKKKEEKAVGPSHID